MPFETLAFDTLIAEYRATGKVPERLNYNTPAEITPEILATLRQIAPNHEPFFLDVTPLPDCRVRRCYGNAGERSGHFKAVALIVTADRMHISCQFL